MRPGIRFAFVLVLGLALVAWPASIVVRETTRNRDRLTGRLSDPLGVLGNGR